MVKIYFYGSVSHFASHFVKILKILEKFMKCISCENHSHVFSALVRALQSEDKSLQIFGSSQFV